MADDRKRIEEALKIAQDGAVEGDHHKMWVIDQMVRALTGCPMETKVVASVRFIDGTSSNGYSYEGYGMSEEYEKFIRDFCDGEDGPCTYSWGIGVPP